MRCATSWPPFLELFRDTGRRFSLWTAWCMPVMNKEQTDACQLCGRVIPAETSGGYCAGCVLSNMLEEGAADTRQRLPSGGAIENHEILEELSISRRALILKARELGRGRMVALKLLPWGALADQEAAKRYHAWTAKIIGLNHPHLIPTYETGEIVGHPYVSMPLIEASDLIRQNRNIFGRPRHTAALVEKIARAVQFAHDRDVLHGCLEPGNILIDRDGEPFVALFHMAGITPRRQLVEVETYECLAPEQIREEAIDRRTDVYGLGTILFFLITGELPFVGTTTLGILNAVVRQRPRPLVPVDEALAAISLKCLNKEKDRRYRSVGELADDLANWRHNRPVSAPIED